MTTEAAAPTTPEAPVTTEAPAPKTDAEYAAAAVASLRNPDAPAAKEAAPEEAPAAKEEAKEDPEAAQPRSKLELRALSAVVREKRVLEQQKQELKAREAALSEATALIEAKRSGDPLRALQAMGYTYEQATEAVVSGKLPAKVEAKALPPEVEELRAEVAAMKKAAAETRERAQKAEFFATVKSLAAGDSEEFELVRTFANHPKANAQQRVWDVLDEHYRNAGSLPGDTLEESIRIAMEHVEKELEAEYVAPVLTSRKLRGRLAPADEKRESAGRPSASPGQRKAVPTTLTNAQAAGATKRTEQAQPRTDEEYQAQALAVLRSGRGR